MSSFRPKLWTVAGGALVIAAGGLAACSDQAAETEPAVASTPAAASGEGEGEGGEAAPASAYDAVDEASRVALRLAHLKGFFLVARAAAPVEGEDAAAALAGQGMLEVYDPAKADYDSAGVNEALLREAAQTGSPSALEAAIGELDRAARGAGGDPAQVVKGMVTISAGLYALVVTDGFVDPIEYQHALGAAMAAKSVADHEASLIPVRDELADFVELWPQVTAPEAVAEAPAPGLVQAQASRVELALSGL